MMETVDKSFFRVKIHNTDALKQVQSETHWVRIFSEFFKIIAESAQRHGGSIVKSLGDGAFVVFDQMVDAAQAAIDLQESLQRELPYTETGLSCKVGIAQGVASIFALNGTIVDYLGTAVDLSDRLCDRARGNAILLYCPTTNPCDFSTIHSQAGLQQQRSSEAYFIEQPPCQLRGIKPIVHCYSLFWQSNPGNYLAASPLEECRPISEANFEQESSFFGKVAAFKKERGFGFIQYYSENHEYKEIYFHMTYVINQVAIEENDHVQFVIKPGKEGRPQACSVLVMGSRLNGQVESLEENGSGYISIRNQASEIIRFYILPNTIQDSGIRLNDMVEFTVGSGSDTEGLIATDIQIQETESPEQQAASTTGDNLQLEATEQAVVTVYFTEKGYGFAKCRRNNIYVHVSELTNPEDIPSPGDLIEFEISPGRDGTYRANNIRIMQKRSLDS